MSDATACHCCGCTHLAPVPGFDGVRSCDRCGCCDDGLTFAERLDLKRELPSALGRLAKQLIVEKRRAAKR